MTIPRFSAEASLYRTSGRYRVAHADQSGMGVEAARMTAQWCYRETRIARSSAVRCRIPIGGTSASAAAIYIWAIAWERGVWTDRAAARF